MVRSWCAEALSIMDKAGAGRAGERQRREFGETAPAPDAGVARCLPQLSPAERKVALEVGAGHTNSEVAEILFISKHTVDAHLRSIFAKVGVRRRAELAALVARECGSTT
jgi:DNA-binding CsgD family transcriptional regulator